MFVEIFLCLGIFLGMLYKQQVFLFAERVYMILEYYMKSRMHYE